MKEKALSNKKEAVIKTAPSDVLQSKVAAAAKNVEKALESYKKRMLRGSMPGRSKEIKPTLNDYWRRPKLLNSPTKSN